MGIPADLTALVFDFDGTLLDLGVDWVQVRRTLGLADSAEPLGAAVQRLRLDGHPLLTEVTDAELAALNGRGLSPLVAATLRTLAGRYALAVCSRNSAEVVRRALEHSALNVPVPVVGREQVAHLKPDPAGLLLALAGIGAEPAQAAMIGDTTHDVEGARAAGMASIVVRNPRLDFPPGGADAYVDRIEDLVPLLMT